MTVPVHQLLAPLQVGEPVFAGDGAIGVTTSGGYGHTLGKSFAFAYVNDGYEGVGSRLEVELRLSTYIQHGASDASLGPPVDAAVERLSQGIQRYLDIRDPLQQAIE